MRFEPLSSRAAQRVASSVARRRLTLTGMNTFVFLEDTGQLLLPCRRGRWRSVLCCGWLLMLGRVAPAGAASRSASPFCRTSCCPSRWSPTQLTRNAARAKAQAASWRGNQPAATRPSSCWAAASRRPRRPYDGAGSQRGAPTASGRPPACLSRGPRAHDHRERRIACNVEQRAVDHRSRSDAALPAWISACLTSRSCSEDKSLNTHPELGATCATS